MITANFIGTLTGKDFSLLSECEGGDAATARVTLNDHVNLPKPLLEQLVELMHAHDENTVPTYGLVIIKGNVDRDKGLALGEDFHIAASDIRVEMMSK